MQPTIKIVPITAERYPIYYDMVQHTQWGNPMLPMIYNDKLWGDMVCIDDQIIGGWVGTIKGDIPLARIIAKSVYFDSYPVFLNADYEATYKQLLIGAIKQHADADKIVMLHLTHWVRGCEMLLNIQENNATFITHLQTTEADLWKLVESKQRNCIRKGEKSGVEILALKGKEALEYLDDFQRLRQRTQQHAIKNHAQASMLLKSDQYFTELFLNPQATLFVGKVEERVAAVALMLQSGNSVYYYSGGSDYELNKKYCCSALVIWKSLLHYNDLGVTIFDMGGVPVQPTKEHPAYGVYAFKRSFGGTYQEFTAGEMIISSWKYRLLQFLLSQRKLLRFLSDKL